KARALPLRHNPIQLRREIRFRLSDFFRVSDFEFRISRAAGEWAGRRSNPRLRFFRPPLKPSQLPAQNKKARHRIVTPGLASNLIKGSLGVTSAADERGGPSPPSRPDARPICVSAKTRRPCSSFSQDQSLRSLLGSFVLILG